VYSDLLITEIRLRVFPNEIKCFLLKIQFKFDWIQARDLESSNFALTCFAMFQRFKLIEDSKIANVSKIHSRILKSLPRYLAVDFPEIELRSFISFEI
jgi:hypothetical protein